MAGFELLLTPATGKSGSRMHVLSISDLKHREALAAMRRIRMNAGKTVNNSIIEQVVSIVGGRLSYINKVSMFTALCAAKMQTSPFFSLHNLPL